MGKNSLLKGNYINFIYIYIYIYKIFPGGTCGKEATWQCRRHKDAGLIPVSGRVLLPGGGHVNPLQYSCLENLTDRRAWQATVDRVAKSNRTEATLHAYILLFIF